MPKLDLYAPAQPADEVKMYLGKTVSAAGWPFGVDDRLLEAVRERSFVGSEMGKPSPPVALLYQIHGRRYDYPLLKLVGSRREFPTRRTLAPLDNNILPRQPEKVNRPKDHKPHPRLVRPKFPDGRLTRSQLGEQDEQEKLAAMALDLYESQHPGSDWIVEEAISGHAFSCVSGLFYHLNFLARPRGTSSSPARRFFAEFHHPSLLATPKLMRLGEIPPKCTAVMSEEDAEMVTNDWCCGGLQILHPSNGSYHGSAGRDGEYCLPYGYY